MCTDNLSTQRKWEMTQENKTIVSYKEITVSRKSNLMTLPNIYVK